MTMLRLAAGISRLGTETAFDVLARAEALAATGRSVINLGIGQPDFKTAPHIVEAARQGAARRPPRLHATPGIPALREAVAEDLRSAARRRRQPGRVVVVPGGKVTMFFAILMFGEPGAEILYPNPGFPIYESVINFSGAKAVPYRAAGGERLLLRRRGRAGRDHAAHAPADHQLARQPDRRHRVASRELDKLVEGLERHPQVAILSDEIYSRITYDGASTSSLLTYPELEDRLILLDGWSKTYAMTGWRLGYGVWPESLVEGAIRLAVNCHSCVNAPTQFAGIAALRRAAGRRRRDGAAFDERRQRHRRGAERAAGRHAAARRAAPSTPSPTSPAPA